jgi:hypothetical protein
MEICEQLAQALESLAGSGSVEVHEDGALLAELSGLHYEVRRQGKHALIHLWSEERNLVRRVLGIVEQSSRHLVLEVQRFGRNRPGRLEFVSTERARSASRLTREKFRARFRRLLAEQFPDEEIRSLTAAPDLEHSFSGAYTRGILRRRGQTWAVIGVSPAEDAATTDAILSFGLLWLDWTCEHARGSATAGVRLFLPAGRSRITAHRLQALAPSAKVELYELDETGQRARRVDPQDIGNLATWLTPRREVEQTLASARETIEKIRALDPGAIDAVVPPGTREVSLRFRGLEFARWRNAEVAYGLSPPRRPLRPTSWKSLEDTIHELQTFRRPQPGNTNHPLYRAQAERWLETLALANPARLDAQLDSRYLYSQVPAFSAGDRGVLDLLGVTRSARLAAVDLKVSEDIQMALQAVDYWLRVRQHQLQGDFSRYGYFVGLELQRNPPLLYLVAPGLRFHPATETILRYLSDDIEVLRIGLNESWRSGLQVVFRQSRR